MTAVAEEQEIRSDPVSVRRIALLGQRDAMVRALYELAQQKRLHRLEVLAMLPGLKGRPTHGADVPGACRALGFSCVEDVDADEQVLRELQAFRPDLIASILWPRRIQPEVLALCRDCINFHPSLLPKHRGSLTQFWAIFDGDAEAGATCHRMVKQFDAGRILHQVSVPMSPGETALSLNLKIAGAIERCFQQALRSFLEAPGLAEGSEWEVGLFPYHRRCFPNGGAIDPEWPDDKVERFIRAMYFPPHAPAAASDSQGSWYFVTTMEQYRSVRRGAAGAAGLSLAPSPDPACPAAAAASAARGLAQGDTGSQGA